MTRGRRSSGKKIIFLLLLLDIALLQNILNPVETVLSELRELLRTKKANLTSWLISVAAESFSRSSSRLHRLLG